MQQTASQIVNPTTVDSHVFLFNFTAAVRASDSMTALINELGPDAKSWACPAVVQLLVFCGWLAVFVGSAKSTLLCLIIVINLLLFLCFHYDA